MRWMLFVALALGWNVAVLAQDMQFEIGNQLTVDTLEGDVSVTCRPIGGGTEYNFLTCYGRVFMPSSYTHVLGPKNLDANRLDLIATHADGSTTQKKKIAYDSVKGQTVSKVNLGIATLTQVPLLHYGLNKIAYKLKKGDDTLLQGSFNVQVNKGINRVCPYDVITSYDHWDCVGSNICAEYFYKNNYCL